MQVPYVSENFSRQAYENSAKALLEVERLSEENQQLGVEVAELRNVHKQSLENLGRSLVQLEVLINQQFLHMATTLSATLTGVTVSTTALTSDLQKILEQESTINEQNVNNAKRLENVSTLIVQNALLNMKKGNS